MTEEIQKSTRIQGLTSVLFIATLIILVYSWHLHNSGQGITFIKSLLASKLIFIPSFFLPTLTVADFQSVLFSVIISSIHVALWMTIGMFTIKKLGEQHFSKNETKQLIIPKFVEKIDENGFYLKSENKNSQIILQTPSGRIIKNILPKIQIRLDRSRLKFKKTPETPLEKLEVALISTLHKHKEWPADPSGFHANVPLYKHSMNVAKKMYSESNGHEYSKIIGLAHDIGKLLTYKKEFETNGEIRWKTISKQHDKQSAHIVSLMPEFKELKPDQQDSILTVLAFSHHPDALPQRKIRDTEMMLINKLRKVDGLATKEDQETPLIQADRDELVDKIGTIVIENILPILSINGSRNPNGHADGWTGDMYLYVAIREAAIRENLRNLKDHLLTEGEYRALQLETKAVKGKGHPATEYIIEGLARKELLLDEHAGIPHTKGMFSIKSGARSFHYVILLDREKIESLMSSIVETWGESQYALKINPLNIKASETHLNVEKQS